jgi:hypothetical protein
MLYMGNMRLINIRRCIGNLGDAMRILSTERMSRFFPIRAFEKLAQYGIRHRNGAAVFIESGHVC